jgi:hypothetical protein
MHWLLIVLAAGTPHQKIAGGDSDQLGFDNDRRVMRTEC